MHRSPSMLRQAKRLTCMHACRRKPPMHEQNWQHRRLSPYGVMELRHKHAARVALQLISACLSMHAQELKMVCRVVALFTTRALALPTHGAERSPRRGPPSPCSTLGGLAPLLLRLVRPHRRQCLRASVHSGERKCQRNYHSAMRAIRAVHVACGAAASACWETPCLQADPMAAAVRRFRYRSAAAPAPP